MTVSLEIDTQFSLVFKDCTNLALAKDSMRMGLWIGQPWIIHVLNNVGEKLIMYSTKCTHPICQMGRKASQDPKPPALWARHNFASSMIFLSLQEEEIGKEIIEETRAVSSAKQSFHHFKLARTVKTKRSVKQVQFLVILHLSKPKIQTHKRFKRMLFIRTKHNMQIWGG